MREQGGDRRELAQLLEVLDRGENERDLARAMRLKRASGFEPAEVDALLAVDLRLLAWNKRAFEIFGFPPELAQKGMPYARFLEFTERRGDYKARPETPAEKLARAQNPMVRKSEQQLPNGRYVEKRRNPMPGGGFVSTYFAKVVGRPTLPVKAQSFVGKASVASLTTPVMVFNHRERMGAGSTAMPASIRPRSLSSTANLWPV